MTYFIQNKNADIYKSMSEELRSDSAILKMAIEKARSAWDSPLGYAQPSALTKENILLAIDNEILTMSKIREKYPILLADREVMTYFIQNKNADIYKSMSEELRSDP